MRSKLIAAGVFLVAFLILVLGAGNPSSLRSLQSGFLGFLTPFLRSGSTLERKFSAFREGLKKLEDLEDESVALRVANRELSATNQTLRGMEAENNRLRKALGYRASRVSGLSSVCTSVGENKVIGRNDGRKPDAAAAEVRDRAVARGARDAPAVDADDL